MQGRNRHQLARYAATRVVGLAALGGIAAFGLGTVGSADANGAGTTHDESAPVTTSVSFTVDLRVQMPQQDAVGWRASGTADFTHHAAEESVTLPPLGLHALDKHKGGVLPGDRSLVLEAKWVAGHAYVTIPSTLSNLVDGVGAFSLPVSATEGVKVDLELDQSAVALTYAKVLLSELANPKAQQHVGTRTINGVSVSGTRVDLTLAQLLKVSPGLSPTMIQDSSMFGNETFPVTVWIDHRGRLIEVTMASTGKGATPSISGTVEFSNYDAAVAITAPAASAVKPISAAVQQLLSGFNLFGTFPLP
jgi:hypothetical protein